jgi:hypothetical protein
MAVAVPDILGVCRVSRGLVVMSELVSDHGLKPRDLRLAGFMVTGCNN